MGSPGSANGVDPIVWRFTVTEVATDEFDYVLEGQSKNAAGGFKSVLTGHGFGSLRRSGWFMADNDAYRSLDPAWGHDTGTTKVTFDLRKLPATIAVDLKPEASKGFATVTVTHDVGSAGEVEIAGHVVMDATKGTLDDVHLVSRWKSEGSGRADAQITEGATQVHLSECWSSSFARVYYTDNANFEPSSGVATACAFGDAKL